LLTVFFGYPSGSPWRRIKDERTLDFAVANPVYVKQINGTTYVFAHGTHFRPEICPPRILKRIADYLQFDRLLGDIEIESDCDVANAANLDDLEARVSRFVDSLWPSSRNNPTSRSDQLWYLYTSLRGRYKGRKAGYHESALEKWSDVKKNTGTKKSRRLTAPSGKPADSSIKRWQEHFRDHMLRYLQEKRIPNDDIVFVYGDTHSGAWGEQRLDSGERIRIYNTGGWVVHDRKQHPDCHLFAIDSDCEEYLLRVSYEDVQVGDDSLLSLAAMDYENHNRNASHLTRFVSDWLLPH
jgi:hypothetical protein